MSPTSPEATAARDASDVDANADAAATKVTTVGIGASAGGLSALKQLFQTLDDAPELALIVIVHLAPEHESHMAPLLQAHSPMPVVQVVDSPALLPRHIYVIPPGRNLETIDTHLRLTPLEAKRIERSPIDHFFCTLAKTHGPLAIGVVLTGTGSDGTRGLRQIRANGGLTIAQDPAEAEYDGMPYSAIANGVADLVLRIAEIPAHIRRFANTAPKLPALPDESDDAAALGDAHDDDVLQRLLDLVRTRTGHDFSTYKPSTILRRVRRRMQLHQIERMDAYLTLMQQDKAEAQRLFDDFLITVTEFFRDPETFEALRATVVPRLFQGKDGGDRVRVWSVGCATGEEAYSIAILLLEAAAELPEPPQVQVFASDLHSASLQRARAGTYTEAVATRVSPARLERFFVRHNGGYRVRSEVREVVVFAPHNLLKDPPFSHVDLVVCRNVLIYLQREAQGDVMRVFHYALNDGGFLLLGSSETLDRSELFSAEDKAHCLFRRRQLPSPSPRLPAFPTPRSRRASASPSIATFRAPATGRSFGALHERMVELYGPPSVLVDEDYDVVHFSAHAGRYLTHPGGDPTNRVYRLVREPLRVDLRAALLAARDSQRMACSRPIQVTMDDGATTLVVVRVRPPAIEDEALQGFFLILFDEVAADDGAASEHAPGVSADALESELDATRQRVQSLIEEYENGQEEMRASNEELQSANEELRSTMEELETSKEELQSMNEELTTVNQENRQKVDELSQMTSDLQNLMASTDIATLFIDRSLRILRFTPQVGSIFNARPSDCGRPLTDLTHRLGYPELEDDARQVLERLVPIEREVASDGGAWYLTRVLPYRSSEDRIDGVVITFVDITKRREGELALRQLAETLEKRTRQVQELATRLARAEQEERRRISQVLHDDLQQLLYGVQMKVRLMTHDAAHGRYDGLDAAFVECDALLRGAIESTRELTVRISPPLLSNEEIVAGLEWLRAHLAKLHGLKVEIVADGDARAASQDLMTLVFQIVRELLFNVAKHAQTDTARVVVTRKGAWTEVCVSDEGGGFDPREMVKDHSGGFGLVSARERLSVMGGELTVASRVGEGTAITIRVPSGGAMNEETTT